MFPKRFTILLTAILLSSCASQKIEEKGWKAYYEDGKLLDYQEKRAEAKSCYETALEKLNESEQFQQEWRAEILAKLARENVLDGNFEEATEETDQALVLACDPKLQGPYHGEVLVSFDDLIDTCILYVTEPDQQIPALELALKVQNQAFKKKHKRRGSALDRLTVAYIIADRMDLAKPLEDELTAAARQEVDCRPFIHLAVAYHLKGDEQKQEELLVEATKYLQVKKPYAQRSWIDHAYLQKLAEHLKSQKRLDEAISVLLDYIEKTPIAHVKSELPQMLADIYAETGDAENADKYYKLAIEAEKKNKRLQRKELRQRLEAYVRFLRKSGRKEEAETIQQEANKYRDKRPWF